MSKLSVEQKTIEELFSNKKVDFLIPDYQRPYAWEQDECETLWNDIFTFAFPDNDSSKFNNNDEYFLGPIVTFKNENDKLEVIDGQQRLTTLMLLLRAFYKRFGNMQDQNSIATQKNIEKCIWKTDEFDNPDKNKLKIDSEVATDNDKDEFLDILKTGQVEKGQKSKYALNFEFFRMKIDKFLNEYPSYFAYLPTRILRNCILLPIEADSQDTALRIFSTLNDRGLPLSDADIFKAKFYKYYSKIGEKDSFIKDWKELTSLSDKIFHPIYATSMDELFTRYMYYERAKIGTKSSTVEALRKFYEKDDYKLLRDKNTFENLKILADFWNDVDRQNEDRFSDKVLQQFFVLNYAPNGMWAYIVSVYFMKNKDSEGKLDDDKFLEFLNKITAFIWAYAMTNPGVNSLRTPIFAEMLNIINDKPIDFVGFKFNEDKIRNSFNHYSFNNNRPITKSMLIWWAFNNPQQQFLSNTTSFDIEHIFSKNRQDKDIELSDNKYLELLGNKSILEKQINIRASDYRFCDKKKYYEGYVNSKNQTKEGTKIQELIELAKNKDDFKEEDIINRNNKIINGFISFLKENNLLE